MAVVVSGASAMYPTSFDGPVGAEGPWPAAPSGAGWKRLAAGETVMLDVVSSFNGYHADTARTFFIGGDVPERVGQAHEACRKILDRVLELLRPGAICSDVYRHARSFVEERGEPEGFMGHGENRVRFLGHGVGLELDELPVLADKLDLELRPGMVLAVEPKAFLPGVGPVGVEDTVAVTADGCARLCDVTEELRAV
jgi:Xaa-Pro aminopeptidase